MTIKMQKEHPAGIPKAKRLKSAPAKGMAFQRRVARTLRRQISPKNVWAEHWFFDSTICRWSQPDILVWRGEKLLVIEVKLTEKPQEATLQLQRYMRVVGAWARQEGLQKEIIGVRAFRWMRKGVVRDNALFHSGYEVWPLWEWKDGTIGDWHYLG